MLLTGTSVRCYWCFLLALVVLLVLLVLLAPLEPLPAFCSVDGYPDPPPCCALTIRGLLQMGLAYKPKKGDALLFWTMKTNGECGRSPTRGCMSKRI